MDVFAIALLFLIWYTISERYLHGVVSFRGWSGRHRSGGRKEGLVVGEHRDRAHVQHSPKGGRPANVGPILGRSKRAGFT